MKYYILVDQSTREAALRTAKIDQMGGFNPETAADMAKRVPEILHAPAATWSESPAYIRTDLEPYTDVRVRRALFMATDFQAINDSLYFGLGQILSWPTWYTVEYADLYLSLDDPECPDSVKELYTYNPDKAKQLLADAGFPTGFNTEIVLTEPQVDYYSVLKDQWSKVGIDLKLDVKESGQIIPIAFSASYKHMFALFYAPNSTWPEQANYTNINNWVNAGKVNDSYVNEMAEKAQAGAVTDFKGSMKITKELMKYLLDQAYCIPAPRYPQENFWWPWLKNYSGETTVGYFPGDSWVRYIWIDQNLKKSLGY
jgi:peptide/nickel transport system substrate-binding protein